MRQCSWSLSISVLGLERQRWSRGHKARGQEHKKNPRPRPRTAFPRTDTLEAKDRNARGQGQGPRTQAQVLSKKKKRSSKKFFRRSPQKNVFQKIFQPLHKILTIQKIVLSSSRGQANFQGLEASRPRLRTSKSVLEAKYVLEDSISVERVCPRKGCGLGLGLGFFCVLGLGLEPCVLDSTSDNIDPGGPGSFNLMFVNQFKRITRVKLSVFILKVAN